MAVWYEGSAEIACDMDHVKKALQDIGGHFVAVVRLMPGMSSVELIEVGDDFITIRTNEGLMERKDVHQSADAGRVALEFSEQYQAGRMVRVCSHQFHEFTANGATVLHHMIISDVKARGFLGFLYRTFGKSNIGKATMKAFKSYLENAAV